MDYHWTCICCGKTFDTLCMDYAYDGPRNWYALTDEEKAKRAKKDSNLCSIDDREFYVRGCLEIPIVGRVEKLVYGVWVSVSLESFRYILDHWDGIIPEGDPPRFGWLMNHVEGYPEPGEIRCHIHIRANNQRPLILLEPTSYPLSVDQRQGVTLEHVEAIASANLKH